MNLLVTGIDFKLAGVRQREQFVFTNVAAKDALTAIKQQWPHLGCVLLSTCNRTELWVSGSKEGDPTPLELLLWVKDADSYSEQVTHQEKYFVNLSGEEAVSHLFRLACGLKSQIMGEDQILSQTRNALALAKEAKSIDSVLDRVFQMAVATAKQIKTEGVLGQANISVAMSVEDTIEEAFEGQRGLSCLILGNGVIGRKTAECLVEAGHQVSVALRQFRHGETIVPAGCKTIAYDDRYQKIADYDVVISATASPHCTLTHEKVAKHLHGASGQEKVHKTDARKRVFFDLAMPPDIEEEIGTIENVTLFNIDDMSDDSIASNAKELEKTELIITEGVAELIRWYTFRSYITDVEDIREAVSADILARTNRAIRRVSEDKTQQKELLRVVENSTKMAIGKMLFGLREVLEIEVWDMCFAALSTAAAKPAVWERSGTEGSKQKKEETPQTKESDLA